MRPRPPYAFLTVTSLIICFVVCTLWVRSYWICDELQINRPTWHELATYRGRLFFAHSGNSSYEFPLYVADKIAGTPWSYDLPAHEWYVCRLQGEYSAGYFYIGIPLWLPLTGLALLTWVFWRRMRRINVLSAFPVELNPVSSAP